MLFMLLRLHSRSGTKIYRTVDWWEIAAEDVWEPVDLKNDPAKDKEAYDKEIADLEKKRCREARGIS